MVCKRSAPVYIYICEHLSYMVLSFRVTHVMTLMLKVVHSYMLHVQCFMLFNYCICYTHLQLTKALSIAKSSTASAGKFTSSLVSVEMCCV